MFLDAGSLLCGLSFDASLSGRLAYEAFELTAPDDAAARIADAELVIANKVRLSGALLKHALNLRRICVAAAGTDNIDLKAAKALGIEVLNVPDYGGESVAEHAIATLLALRRHLLVYASAAVDGRWSTSPHFFWHGP